MTSFCTVIVWQAPFRAYGFITGYQLRLGTNHTIEEDRARTEEDQVGSGKGQVVLVRKSRDQLFHRVLAEDIPQIDTETFVQV